jgi:glycosyltransferase involved in cell wall biosynthesis
LRYAPREAWGKYIDSRRRRKKKKVLLAWLSDLTRHPPDVLIGANVNAADGIRNHLIGIRDYSALDVALSPPDEVMRAVSYYDLYATFRDIIQNFEPTGIRAIHSHVYPYFIEWCHRHRKAGPLWVHTYHLPYLTIDGMTPLEPWQEEINRALIEHARHAHVLISVSRWQQKYLLDEHDISTQYVPNGVDIDLCDRGTAAEFDMRVVGHKQFVLFVGRNDPVKNPLSFVLLAQKLPHLTFVMIGNGLTRDTVAALQGKAPPPNLVILGPLPRVGVQNALAACSALVVPSIREGLPTLVLEAMAHRRSIVVADDPGCVEAIDGGRFGFIYRQGDISDMAEKTEAALVDRERRLGARDHVLAEYDWRVVAPKLDAIYRMRP